MKKTKLTKRKKIVITITIIVLALLCISCLLVTIFLPINSKSIQIVGILVSPQVETIDLYRSQNPSTENNQLNLSVEEQEVNHAIPYEEEALTDHFFVEDTAYILEGADGNIKQVFNNLYFTWREINFDRIFLRSTETTPPESKKTFTGTADLDNTKKNISNEIHQILALLTKGNDLVSNSFVLYTEPIDVDVSRFQGITVGEITFNPTSAEDEHGNLIAGEVTLTMGNCNRTIEEDLVYDYQEHSWKLLNSEEFIAKLCIPQFVASGEKLIGTCLDCALYPVNKKYGLRPDYLPSVEIFELQTNAVIGSVIQKDLKEMYAEAQRLGHSIIINSSYRSYGTQASTFEGWVQSELAKGRDRATAEAIANTYSARPGFSEHQLGTTLDIATTQCASFGRGCGPSEALWSWLFNNGYKYGFVLSYPADKESRTGYVFEPWHYRWIGRELASEFKQVEATSTLQEFLLSKNQF